MRIYLQETRAGLSEAQASVVEAQDWSTKLRDAGIDVSQPTVYFRSLVVVLASVALLAALGNTDTEDGEARDGRAEWNLVRAFWQLVGRNESDVVRTLASALSFYGLDPIQDSSLEPFAQIVLGCAESVLCRVALPVSSTPAFGMLRLDRDEALSLITACLVHQAELPWHPD